MKRVLTIIFLLLFYFININNINADAFNDFLDTVEGSNQYIDRYSNVDKYIVNDEEIPFKYANSILSIDSRFKKGGLLNVEEFELSLIDGFSYLYTGTKFFTMSDTLSSVYEISSYTPVVISKDELSGLRVTEYVKEGTTVSGTGSYIDPWMFYSSTSNDYIVAFDSMGGIGGQKSSVVATRGYPMPTILTVKPIKTNYIFKGWYDSNNVQYYDENGQSARNYDKNTGTILYAKWTSKSLASITTSNYMKSTTQVATLNCNHTDGIVGYYWGTTAPTSSSTYTTVTSTTHMSVDKVVDSIGTYYLSCKDMFGDVSQPTSITYYNYTVKGMLNNVSGSTSTYNTSNYTLANSNTYIAAENQSISVSDATTIPSHSNSDKYVGYSLGDATSSSVTLSNEETTLSENGVIYTAWFDRNKISIYYQVQSGESLIQGSGATATWAQDSSGIITRNGTRYKEEYKSGVTSIDLMNNSTSSQFAISKIGYKPSANSEWKCHSGCANSSATFSQNSISVSNTDTELCDSTTGDCNMILTTNFVVSYDDNNYVVRKLAGNLMDGNQLEDFSASLSGSGSSYTMTAASSYAGAYIHSDMFVSGRKYVLMYDIKKTSGTLKSIGGHSTSATQISFKINGVNSSSQYVETQVNNVSNNYDTYSVVFEFTYNGNQDNNNIYIQPNRGYSDSVSVNISNLKLYEIVDSFSKHYNDLYTSNNLNSPGKNGYTFDKWYNNSTLSTALTTSTRLTQSTATFEDIYTNGSNVNIYGSMTPKTITIAYDANSGSGAPSSHNYIYSSVGTTNLSSTVPTRSGYQFLGWSLSSTATSASYSSGQAWRRSNIPSSGTTYTLYAIWTPKAYSIKYNANGGSGAPSDTTYTYDNSNTYLSSTIPTRTGYTFAGWSQSSTATSASYAAGSAWARLNIPGNGSYFTLYAVWTANTYTVTFNCDGGSGAPSQQTATYGQGFTLTSSVCSKTGYTQNGWKDQNNITWTASNTNNWTWSYTYSPTLTAQWTTNTYTLTYSPGKGSCNPTSVSKNYGSAWGTLCSPSADGYVFEGWNTASNGSGTTITSSSTASSNITVYGQWTPKVYTLVRYSGNYMTMGNLTADRGATVTKNSTNNYTIVSGTNNYGGAKFPKVFTVDKDYVIKYDLTVTSGTLQYIGGHMGSSELSMFEIDGVNYKDVYSSNDYKISTSGTSHTIYIKFKYKKSSDEIWLQPNRSIGTNVTVRISNLGLYEYVDESEKNYGYNYTNSDLSTVLTGNYGTLDWYGSSAYSSKISTSTAFTSSNAEFENIAVAGTKAYIYGSVVNKSSIPVYCVLNANSSGVYFDTKQGATSYGLSKSSTVTYNSTSSLSLSAGTYYGFVKDNSNHTFTCYLTIVDKVQSGYTCSASGTLQGYIGACDCWSAVDPDLHDVVMCGNKSSCAAVCSNWDKYSGTCTAQYTCPNGTKQMSSTCYASSSTTSCPSGYSNARANYVCPSGTAISGANYCKS